MKNSNTLCARALYMIPLFLLLLTAACSVAVYPNVGLNTSVPPVKISSTAMNGSWQNADIEVVFQQKMIDDNFVLQGKLFFRDAIVQTYPVIRYFFLQINVIDAEEKIISQHPIPVNYRAFQLTEEMYPILINLTLPQQADSFTFSYSGEFADYGGEYPDTNYIVF